MVKQNWKCPLCSRDFKWFSIEHIERDHITPISQGGSDTTQNIQLVHRSCHERKSAEERKKMKKTA